MSSSAIVRAASGLRNVGGTVSIDPTYPNVFTGLQTFSQSVDTVQTPAFGSTISWNMALGTNILIACTSNTNFTLNAPTGLVAGMRGFITVTQWTTGGQIITWPTIYRGIGGIVPVLSTSASATDQIEWYCPDGINIDLILHANFISGVAQDGQLDFSTGNNSVYFPSVIN